MKTQIFAGGKSVKKALNMLLEEKDKEVLAFGISKAFTELYTQKFRSIFHKKRLAKKMAGKALYNDDLPTSIYIATHQVPSLEFRFLPPSFNGANQTTFFVAGSKVAIFYYQITKVKTVLIDDKKIAKAYKNQFYTLWPIARRSIIDEHMFYTWFPDDSVQPGHIPETVRKDVIASTGEKLGKIYGGYFGSASIAEKFWEAIEKSNIILTLPKKIKIADFGGGHGQLIKIVSKHFKECGFKVQATLIDLQQESLHVAKQNMPDMKVMKADLRNLPKNLPKYDLIIMRSVLQYLPLDDQRQVMSQIKKHLEPKGFFINQLSTNDRLSVIRQAIYNAVVGRDVHATLWSEYKKMTEENRLSVEIIGDVPPLIVTTDSIIKRWYPFASRDKKDYIVNVIKAMALSLPKTKGVTLDKFGKMIMNVDYKIILSHHANNQNL